MTTFFDKNETAKTHASRGFDGIVPVNYLTSWLVVVGGRLTKDLG
jgi:hypothetical protein